MIRRTNISIQKIFNLHKASKKYHDIYNTLPKLHRNIEYGNDVIRTYDIQ